MTPLVAAMFAATIRGVVSPLVVVIAPLDRTLNDCPRRVSIVLLCPAFLGRTLFEKWRPVSTWYSRMSVSTPCGTVQMLAAVRGPNGEARNAASVGAKTVSCSSLVRAAPTAGSAHPTAATRVVKSPFATARPTTEPDDRDGETTGEAARAAGASESNSAPAP